MDPLVRLGDHRRTPSRFGPFAAQSRDEPEPYSLPASTIERRALGEVALRRVVDRHLLARRDVHRPRALRAGHELVAQPDVRERAAHHHLVVAAARAVRVEVLALDAVLDEVLRRPASPGLIEPAGEMWSVVTESPSQTRHARALDVADGAGLARHALEVRRMPHVRRVRRPTRRARPRAPAARATSSSPVKTSAYVSENCSARTDDAIVSLISFALGQMSRRKTSSPSEPVPSGSSPSRCPCGRRARTRRRAAATRGSSPSPRDGCAPRSCGCPRAPSRRRGRPRRSPPRSRRRAARSCRCTSCSRSRRC